MTHHARAFAPWVALAALALVPAVAPAQFATRPAALQQQLAQQNAWRQAAQRQQYLQQQAALQQTAYLQRLALFQQQQAYQQMLAQQVALQRLQLAALAAGPAAMPDPRQKELLDRQAETIVKVTAAFAGIAALAVYAMANPDRDLVDVLGVGVLALVRPSTLLADADHRPRAEIRPAADHLPPGSGAFDMKIEWFGAITQTPYESHFRFVLRADQTSFQIVRFTYEDNCPVPAPDLRLLNAVLGNINARAAGR